MYLALGEKLFTRRREGKEEEEKGEEFLLPLLSSRAHDRIHSFLVVA